VGQIIAAANHLSFLVAAEAHARWPELGPVTPHAVRLARQHIHTDPNLTYAQLLEPHSFPMGTFRPEFPLHTPIYHGQLIGPIAGDDRGSYLTDVRMAAGLPPLPPLHQL
jgi:hypothetical protein